MSPQVTKRENFVRVPHWYLRQFVPHCNSVVQIKLITAILDQVYGYEGLAPSKKRDHTTLSWLAKHLNVHRSSLSPHVQLLVEAGVLEVTDKKGKLLNTPQMRRRVGQRRGDFYLRVPWDLEFTPRRLALLHTPRKDFVHVLQKDKYMSRIAGSKPRTRQHNNIQITKDGKYLRRKTDGPTKKCSGCDNKVPVSLLKVMRGYCSNCWRDGKIPPRD